MKKITLLLLLIIGSYVQAIACLNELTLKDGSIISYGQTYAFSNGEQGGPTGHFFIKNKQPVLKRLDSLWKATHDIDYYSDYGLVLILDGQYEKAIQTYLQIEKIKPGLYATASNLGTAYELSGNDQNALKWIKRAVEINLKSHDGSEWLHVNILEAKLKGDSYITSDFLIKTNFGTDTIPVTTLTKAELIQLKASIFYQLNERISFIKPQNKIVAQLLFDLANIQVLLNSKYSAAMIYKQAKEYGFSDPLWELRNNYVNNIISSSVPVVKTTEPLPAFKENNKVMIITSIVIITGVVVLIVFGTFFLLKIIRRKKSY